MAYVTEIASGATVLDVADKGLMALRTSGNANKALVVNSNGDGYATYNLTGKLDIAQGSPNAGKALVVGADGNVAVSALKTINNNSIVGEGNIQSGHTWTTTPASGGIGGASSTTPAVVVENYCNGTEWYRVWSDGWIEQGGKSSNANGQVTLSKTYSDTNYTAVVCFVASTNIWEHTITVGTKATTTITFRQGGYEYSGGNITGGKSYNWYASGY